MSGSRLVSVAVLDLQSGTFSVVKEEVSVVFARAYCKSYNEKAPQGQWAVQVPSTIRNTIKEPRNSVATAQ